MGIVQKLTPVKDSIIWSLQKQYAEKRNPADLKEVLVAEGSVNNCNTADAYAAMAASFMRDLAANGITEKPLILEIGGGTGKFAWLFLNRLCNYQFGDDEELPEFDYLLTDPSRQCVDSWKAVKRFSRLIDRGILNFGQLEMAAEPVIRTGGEVLSMADLGDRPILLISNYQFDTLPADLFRVKDNQVQRVLLRLDSDEPGFELASADSYDSLKEKFSSRRSGKSPTGHVRIDAILAQYAELDGDFYVTVPETGFRFLENFIDRTAPTLLIASDQAYTDPEEFDLESPFVLDDYFAQFTNFDILAELFRSNRGTVEFGSHPDPDFATGAFLYPGRGRASDAFPRTTSAAQYKLEDFDLCDSHQLLDLLKESVEEPNYRQIFAWMRLSKFDPDVAQGVMPFMFEELQQGHDDPDEETIHDLFMASYHAYFPERAPATYDIQLAQLFIGVGLHQEALDLIDAGLADFGEGASRRYVRALALLKLERAGEARADLDRALKIDREYGPALRLIEDRFKPKQVKAQPKKLSLAAQSDHLRTSYLDPEVRTKAWEIFSREGCVLIDDMLGPELLDELRASYHERVENWRIAGLGKPNNVGDKRFTVPIRVRPPFNSTGLFANPVLMDLLKQAMGEKPVLSAFGAVVTRRGARAQHIHREHPLLFHDDAVNVQIPCYAVNVLFPLVDLDEKSGGTQVWERTHQTEEDYQWQGESTKVYTKAGSALILDYRLYHGGMPCQATHNRPLLFLSYSMPWFTDTLAFDSHAAVGISPAELEEIPEEHRPMFKYAKKLAD